MLIWQGTTGRGAGIYSDDSTGVGRIVQYANEDDVIQCVELLVGYVAAFDIYLPHITRRSYLPLLISSCGIKTYTVPKPNCLAMLEFTRHADLSRSMQDQPFLSAVAVNMLFAEHVRQKIGSFPVRVKPIISPATTGVQDLVIQQACSQLGTSSLEKLFSGVHELPEGNPKVFN
jgi:hypothetical protein